MSSEDEGNASSDNEGIEIDDQSGITQMNRLVQFVGAGIMKYGARNSEQIEKLVIRSWNALKIPESQELITADFIQEIIRKMNAKIAKFDLEIKITFGEFTGEQLFVLVMTKENPMIMFQTKYKKQELEMIQNIITSMLAKENDYSLSLSECIEVAQKVNARLTRRDGEKFIREVIHAFYFTEIPSNTLEDDYVITLGARLIQEFSSIILEKFPGVVSSCKLCVQYLIHGYKCPVCDITAHIHCAQGYLARTNKCPAGNKCNGSWRSVEELRRTTIFGGSGSSSTSGRDGGPPKKKRKPIRGRTRVVESSASEEESDSES